MSSTMEKTKTIDLRIICRKLYNERKLFLIILSATFILSCLYIISIPRTYSTQTKMAPEVESDLGNGTLNSLASVIGLDLSNMKTSDAITPLLYPDLMEDNGFVTNIFKIKIKDPQKKIETDYYHYLKDFQEKSWWLKIFSLKRNEDNDQVIANPYQLTQQQNIIAEKIRKNIIINVNSKNGVITISTTAQSPLVCKILADSVRDQLQKHITAYRTNKARTDWLYYKKLTEEAKQAYEKARQLYGSYTDANSDVVLQSYRLKQEDLENDMQLKFNAYSALNNQQQSAKARVQERTPAFTIIKGAAVPLKPTGPKRMIFVLSMLVLISIITTLIILRKDISEIFI